MAGAAGNNDVWNGSEFHMIPSYEDLTVAQVTQVAPLRWLRPEEYLAILMNHVRYVPLYLHGVNNLPVDVELPQGGRVLLCDLATQDEMPFVLIEENAVLVRGIGHMLMQRFGNPTIEKRRYTLLTGGGMALFHYRPITRADKKIVMLKMSANELNDKVGNLRAAWEENKNRIAGGIVRAFNRGRNRGRGG